MGYVQEARENHVKKKVEEALRSKMKQKALKECDVLAAKYAECATGKTISIIWQCRKQAKELNECLHQYTNDSVLEEMKKEYMLQQDAQGSHRYTTKPAGFTGVRPRNGQPEMMVRAHKETPPKLDVLPSKQIQAKTSRMQNTTVLKINNNDRISP